MERIAHLPIPPDLTRLGLLPWANTVGASTVMAQSQPTLGWWTAAPSASTVMVLEESLRQIEQWYRLPAPEAVRRFIRQHVALASLLVEAIDPLTQFFGPAPRVSLRLVSDPEVEDWDELFAYIQVSISPEEALERLHQLDEEWFLDRIDRR